MSRKSRLLRILLTLLVVVGFTGYFAFSTFLYSPFEGGLGADLSGLVDRRVDFFFARADLERLFDGFPRLAVMDELEQQEAWRTWEASPESAEVYASLGVDDALARVRELTDSLPLGIEPQDVFGARDLALAGFFRGPDLAQADWAVYGTLDGPGKLAFSLLRYPGVLGLEEQGLVANVEEGYVALSGVGMPRELYLARVLDVGIVSTSSELVETARELEAGRFKDSLLDRGLYFDHIHSADRAAERDELEVILNTRALFENLQVSGAWPDAKSQDLTPALLGKLFQLNTVNKLVGVVGVHGGVSLDLHGELSSELMTPVQKSVYRERQVTNDDLADRVACFAPSDASLVSYVQIDMADLLEQVQLSMEPDMVSLIEDALRNVGYRTLTELRGVLAGALRDRALLILRPNDYAEDPNGPPHDDTPVPAWALVTWIKDDAGDQALITLRDRIGSKPQLFGLKGRNPGESGYFRNFVGGIEIREFWNEFIPGTGVIATGNVKAANGDSVCIVSNSFRMIEHVIKTESQGAPTHPRLSERTDFIALSRSSLDSLNLGVWLNPVSAAKTLRAQARRRAEDSIVIDWNLERARAEDKVLKEHFAGKGYRRGSLSPDVQKQVDELVEPLLQEVERHKDEVEVPQRMAAWERGISYLELVRAGYVALALDPGYLDLSARFVAPLDE